MRFTIRVAAVAARRDQGIAGSHFAQRRQGRARFVQNVSNAEIDPRKVCAAERIAPRRALQPLQFAVSDRHVFERIVVAAVLRQSQFTPFDGTKNRSIWQLNVRQHTQIRKAPAPRVSHRAQRGIKKQRNRQAARGKHLKAAQIVSEEMFRLPALLQDQCRNKCS